MKFLIHKQNYAFILSGGLLLIMLFTFSACDIDDNQMVEERNWQLTWEDDFEGAEGQSPDANNWVFDIGRGPNGDGWGNAELQTYTDAPENVSLDGQGNLAISVLNDGGFTSARITTKGKFEQAYGRFEARIKMPYGPGLWPAFWLLGSNIDQVGWPQCGEIDIVELYGHKPSIVHGSVHGPGYSGGSPITGTYGLANGRFDADFYVFRLDWGEDFIQYYVNDYLAGQIKAEDVPGEWVFDQPFYILLNVALGGNSAGLPFPTAQTIYPQTMLVDYVRVYKEVE